MALLAIKRWVLLFQGKFGFHLNWKFAGAERLKNLCLDVSDEILD